MSDQAPSEAMTVSDADRVCTAVSAGMSRLGDLLFVGGWVIGPDRTTGASPSGYGDDRVVSLAVVTKVGADLAASAQRLLRAEHRYSAMALLRQIVEVEYLAWAFAREPEEARRWLNADDDDLRDYFRPHELRRRSQGTFRAEEYANHCSMGGHPSPRSRTLLDIHAARLPIEWLWTDLAMHLSRLWPSLMEASEALGLSDVVASIRLEVTSGLDEVL